MTRDFDTWNTRENFLSQNPRKASQERFLLVYLVFTCYWRQICCTHLSKPSSKLRSWAPLLVHDATVTSSQLLNQWLNLLHTYIQMYKHVHTYQLDQNRRTEIHFCMKTETLDTNHKIMYDHFFDLTIVEVSFIFMGK